MMLSMSMTANAQYVRNGNTFTVESKAKSSNKSEPIKTKFTWKDSKGKTYVIYISSKGSCFVIKVSAKTNKEYRQYLGTEISKEIAKELGIAYNPKK